MTSFYNSLIAGEDETLIFDITSLSSASRNIDWLEWGYNRDGLDLPQVNLGLVLSLHRHLPLYFKLFPGSINDVVTLKNLVAEVKAFGITKSLFILDRGFYSENNIKEMSDEKIDFILPLPFSVNVGKGLISATNKDIESPANAKRFGGDIFYVLESDIQIGDVNAYGYVLFNKKREGLETNSFYNRLIDIECTINGKEFRNPIDQFKRTAGNFERYFEYTLDGKTIHISRRVNAISQAVNRFGKTILISATKRSWDEVLSLYRERDEVEKKFDDLKNELEVMPLRVQKIETLQGLLFIFFISLILRAILLRRARDAKLLDKSSIEEILMEWFPLAREKIVPRTHRPAKIPKDSLMLTMSMSIRPGAISTCPMTTEKMSMVIPRLISWPMSRMVLTIPEATPKSLLSTELMMAFTLGDEKKANPRPMKTRLMRMVSMGVSGFSKAKRVSPTTQRAHSNGGHDPRLQSVRQPSCQR